MLFKRQKISDFRVSSFTDLIGQKIEFNGQYGVVAEYDSWDTFLVSFPDDIQIYLGTETILQCLIDDKIVNNDIEVIPGVQSEIKEDLKPAFIGVVSYES